MHDRRRQPPTELRPDGLRTPHPHRFPLDAPERDACLAAHAVAIERGDMGYLDPLTGLFVMTATNLASRPCCDRGCRHCPWVA